MRSAAFVFFAACLPGMGAGAAPTPHPCAAPALPAKRALLQRGHPQQTATAMPTLLSRLPWWVCGGDTDARHLPISASSINRKQPKTAGRTSDSAALSRGASGSQGGAARGERPLGPRRGWRCPGCVPTSGPVVGLRCPRWPRGSTWRCPSCCRHLVPRASHAPPRPEVQTPRAWETPEFVAGASCIKNRGPFLVSSLTENRCLVVESLGLT